MILRNKERCNSSILYELELYIENQGNIVRYVPPFWVWTKSINGCTFHSLITCGWCKTNPMVLWLKLGPVGCIRFWEKQPLREFKRLHVLFFALFVLIVIPILDLYWISKYQQGICCLLNITKHFIAIIINSYCMVSHKNLI